MNRNNRKALPGFPSLQCNAAFSLVEVVISLAVVALALVSILGLLGVFLKGSTDTVSRQEALEVCQPLNSYLQNQGFNTVFTWLKTGGTIPNIFAFNVPVDLTGTPITTPGSVGGAPVVYVVSNATTDSNYTHFSNGSYLTNCTGRIYYISISLSTNVPLHFGVSQTLGYTGIPASTASFPSGPTDTTFLADAALPISVRVYAVPPPPFTVTSASTLETQNFIYPILTYDTTLSR